MSLNYSATTSKGTSTTTWRCKRTEALYLPKALTDPPVIVMYSFSIAWPAFAKFAAISIVVIEPNSLWPPSATLADNLTSKPFRAVAVLVA